MCGKTGLREQEECEWSALAELTEVGLPCCTCQTHKFLWNIYRIALLYEEEKQTSVHVNDLKKNLNSECRGREEGWVEEELKEWEQRTHCSRRVGERVLGRGSHHRWKTTCRTSASATTPRKLDTNGQRMLNEKESALYRTGVVNKKSVWSGDTTCWPPPAFVRSGKLRPCSET